MDNGTKGEGGEHVFKHDMPKSATDVNSGHNPASAPVVEMGGKNPRDFSKSNSQSK